jgi:multiple sugar transport system permease protein
VAHHPRRSRTDEAWRSQLWLMALPFLAGTAVLTVLPALAGLPLAFTDYSALSAPRWVGLDNLRALPGDPIFLTAVLNSALYVAVAVPLRLLGALVLALLLARPFVGRAGYRVGFYLPTVVPDVAWALVWLWLLNPIYGPVNALLRGAGLPAPLWMADPAGARAGVIVMMVWQIGEGLIVCLAALAAIPEEIFEQAAIDGAGTLRTIRDVTLPLVAPALLLLLLRDTIFSLQANFVPALVLGGGGGPNYATTFLPMYVYTTAFEYLRFGYAAAITWVMYAVTALLVVVQLQVARRWRVEVGNAG